LRGPVLDAIRHHHENFDGSGYPDGLAGDDIPIGARVIMIADTVDAMTSDRPYRKALTLDAAIGEVRKHSGRQFDPRLADVLASSGTIKRILGSGNINLTDIDPEPSPPSPRSMVRSVRRMPAAST
jgi:HD-GYP domain-containing protein (c-di-GMP phosphodiesterase class II)